MEMGFPWESHGKCPMQWDEMGQHALHLPWEIMKLPLHLLRIAYYWTEIDESEIENLLNKIVTRNMSARMIMNRELF